MLSGRMEAIPGRIRLEAASVCQLRCPCCPTATGQLGRPVGSGMLRFEDFRRLVDANPRLRKIELSNWGEIFLNPELLDILRHAHERGVALSAKNGVNLNAATEQVLEGLVRYRFRLLTVSIDGASPENYRRYRVGGDYLRVLRHIEAINVYKRRWRSVYPILTWKFILFGHNERELPAARRRAAELGMLFYPDINWDQEFSPVRDPGRARRESGLAAASLSEWRAGHASRHMKGFCLQLWNEPQINWDGEVLGCCINRWGTFGGNAFRDGLAASLRSEGLLYARRMLLGRAPARVDVPCARCPRYEEMRREGRWIRPESIRRQVFFWSVKGFLRGVLLRGPWNLRARTRLSYYATRFRFH